MKILRAEALHLKAPLETVYGTTFSALTHRQAVLVILTDENGVEGIGETYVNFPVWSPYDRLASYREAFFPDIVGMEVEDIEAVERALWRKHFRASLQGNCLGATMQALCAVSAALWDMKAKRNDVPLRRIFSDKAADRVAVYGSGINPPFPEEALQDALNMGMTVFKLKLGFGDDIDRNNIRTLKHFLGDSARLAVDVNRSWTFEKAVSWMSFLADNDIAWLEEPLDPVSQKRYPEFIERATVPVSAGENFLIPPDSDFETENVWGQSFNESRLAPDIIQPAIVKNCCFGDAVRFVRHIESMGKKAFPHFLGSAPGMAASAQLAALTADPHLEWDINPNPLRTSLFDRAFTAEGGFLELVSAPGIGWELDRDRLKQWTVGSVSIESKDR